MKVVELRRQVGLVMSALFRDGISGRHTLHIWRTLQGEELGMPASFPEEFIVIVSLVGELVMRK